MSIRKCNLVYDVREKCAQQIKCDVYASSTPSTAHLLIYEFSWRITSESWHEMIKKLDV